GGVVPEVAARKHVENIMPVLLESLSDAKIKKEDIDVVAVTNGPGLATSLLVGVETARILSFGLNKKLVAVNHIEAHILSNMLSNPKIKFPALCLVVSGGHTQLVLIKDFGKYKIIGETVDDAVGECFDKVAKILGLGYPGGPIISKIAEKGNPEKFDLPRPMLRSGDFNFSFSGLKTAVLYLAKKLAGQDVRKKEKVLLKPSTIKDIAASFQQAAVDVLVEKTTRAAEKYKVKTVMLAGGVSANKKLREQLKSSSPVNCVLPDIKYSTDNAAMIAVAGYFHAEKKDFISWDKIDINPNLRI
ncbi:MAG: tRNA (adenosine(37)-N6)-threonylcarbamoyltransferase complex transferase subunit TsaD, partial [Parcubacteria group bacterium]|nr:tRNA (adenosine(37)-N6)-threonylcarbamoyltransferase complex transferase subunit TsaD [Parcubacteria group bacterium]